MLTLADPAVAIRESVVVTRLDHVRLLRLRGADVRDVLDHLCAGTVRVRDGQLQHVLLLDENAHCFADAHLLCDDEEYDLLAEGPTARELVGHVRRYLPPNVDIQIDDRSQTHAVIGVDGPYAWELVSRVAGADAIGLPYLTCFHTADWRCYRAGKTGEYGYGLIVSHEGAEALESLLMEKGESLDVARGNLDVLDQCALENFYFNIRREGRAGLTPIELQLQWRVAYDKEAVGLDALRAHRERGPAARATTLVAAVPVRAGDEVRLDGEPVGHVLNAGWSTARGDCVALALIDRRCAHAGLDGFVVGEDTAARSMSPPVLANRSLFVSPQLHAYATRAELAMPPIARR